MNTKMKITSKYIPEICNQDLYEELIARFNIYIYFVEIYIKYKI